MALLMMCCDEGLFACKMCKYSVLPKPPKKKEKRKEKGMDSSLNGQRHSLCSYSCCRVWFI